MATQIQTARTGTISDEVEFVAQAETINAELVRDEVAAGRLVIPANKLHLKTNLKPVGIGRALTTKVNANIGTSSVRSSIEDDVLVTKTGYKILTGNCPHLPLTLI